MFQPIIQDESQATFTNLIKKDNKIIDPTNIDAQTLYNHWRAYEAFPGVAFKDEYFNCIVKIVACQSPINNYISKSDLIISGIQFTKYNPWIVIESEVDIPRVMLVCKDSSLLPVSKIVLESGKQINFAGYIFH